MSLFQYTEKYLIANAKYWLDRPKYLSIEEKQELEDWLYGKRRDKED